MSINSKTKKKNKGIIEVCVKPARNMPGYRIYVQNSLKTDRHIPFSFSYYLRYYSKLKSSVFKEMKRVFDFLKADGSIANYLLVNSEKEIPNSRNSLLEISTWEYSKETGYIIKTSDKSQKG